MSSKLLKSISDDELLRRLSGLVQESRRVESELVAHNAEVDERRLYTCSFFLDVYLLHRRSTYVLDVYRYCGIAKLAGQVLIFLSNLRTVPRARLSC